MAKLHRKIRTPFEAGAVHAALALIPRLPRRGVLLLAESGGRIGCLLDRRGRRVGLANLDAVFGESKTAAEKKKILRASFVTMARTILDTFWFARDSARRLERYTEIDESMQAFFQNKAQICMTAHFGNWEILGQTTALKGFPIHSIASPVKNKTVDKYFIRAREATGQKIIPRTGALRKLIKVLRQGGKTAFLADQNTKEEEGGIWIDCFGLPAPVTSAPAMLSARTGTEVLLGFGRPLPDGSYRVYVTERFAPPETVSEETIRTLTEQINAATEREILRHPEHWLWMYKRWKKKKPGREAAGYPFYTQAL
jgi:KDO2-lipid IV(A) lauroyltransferase